MEGIIDVSPNGSPDSYEVPQEALAPYTCCSCRKFDGECCTKDGKEKDPDNDTCEDIDYEEEWLDTEYGYRDPVRCEYSSDKTYEQACKAIRRINAAIKEGDR